MVNIIKLQRLFYSIAGHCLWQPRASRPLSSEPEFRVCMRVGLGARVCTSGSECGRRMKKPAWRQEPTHLPCRSQAAGCCGVRGAGRDGRKLTARGGARICWLLVLAPGEEKYGQLLTVSVSLEMDDLHAHSCAWVSVLGGNVYTLVGLISGGNTGNGRSPSTFMCLSVCLRRKRLHACRVNFGGNNFVWLLPLPRPTAPSFPPAVPSLRFASPSTPSSPTSSNRLAVRQNLEVLLITKVSALRKKSGQNEVTWSEQKRWEYVPMADLSTEGEARRCCRQASAARGGCHAKAEASSVSL